MHILCYGITPEDHEWLQAHAGDVETVAEYLHEREIACALAHPFYAVAAPLLPRHRRRLAQLFGIWEVRNGSRAPELNLPAAVYIDTHGGTGIGGTDDHAGVDIGRTWTEAPPAATPQEFLAHMRAGRVAAHGAQGSAAKWAHSAMALTVRALGRGDVGGAPPDPSAVLRMVERVMSEGDARSGAIGADLGPDDARAPAARLARVDRPRPLRGRPDRAPSVRRLQPLRPLPPRPPRARAQAAGRRRPRPRRRRRGRARRLGSDRARAVRVLRRRRALRPGRRVPRAREGQARRPRPPRPDPRGLRRRRRRRHARRHPHARRDPRARRARASRSR